ncbi:MAG: winged helix-turn-helix transcriptional regulator [Candidatus Aenigmarchaeota archaeon]|nr:winged helix-turn-helix transcriptional regulator [Candidatus Aenigmarchaeota archaeon]
MAKKSSLVNETEELRALDIRSRILKLIEKSGGLTISEISRDLGMHYTTASKYLAVLEAEKKVIHRRIGMAKLFVIKKAFALVLIFTFLSAVVLPAYAIPNKIPINGRLTSLNDTAINASTNFTFMIYNAKTGGSIQWSELQENLTVSTGLFSALLGNNTPINVTFDDGSFLEIAVNNETVSPRFELGSVPYTFTANQTNFAKSGARALGDFLPNADSSYDLGLQFLRWRNGNFINVNATGYVSASVLQLITGGVLLFPNNIITSAMIQSLDQSKLSITLPIANTTGSFPQSRLSIESLPITNISNLAGSGQCSGGSKAVNVTLNNSGLFVSCAADQDTTDSGWTTSASAVYNDTAGISVLIGSRNAAAAFNTVITGSVNVTGAINASRLLVRADTDANITVWESGGGTVASVNITGNATFAGIRIPNLPGCDTLDTNSAGIVSCGSDAQTNRQSLEFLGYNKTTVSQRWVNVTLSRSKKFLIIYINITGYSDDDIARIAFSDDGQANYAGSASDGLTNPKTTVSSTTGIPVSETAVTTQRSLVVHVFNALNSTVKRVMIDGLSGTDSAATAPTIQIARGIWVNRTANITMINLFGGAGGANLLGNTEITVFGADV